MTLAASRLRRSFLMHGVGLEVRADDPAVIEAIELRLRDFSGDSANGDGIRLEFVTGDAKAPSPPASPSRPVYDTPYGSLRYFAEIDVLSGELGGVSVECEAGRGVAKFRSARFVGRALYFATHPLATVSLMELLERRNLFSLHAACLAGASGSGVLLCGPSGSGKSTLALALAHAGMSFLSDDVVFLVPACGLGDVRVLGFADTIGLSDYAGECFPELGEQLPAPPSDGFPKRLGRFEELFGAPAAPSCQPRAIVFPQVVGDRPSELSLLDPGEALVRLVPDVLLTEPRATQAHLRAIASLLGQVDCYTLRSGRDLKRAAGLVSDLV